MHFQAVEQTAKELINSTSLNASVIKNKYSSLFCMNKTQFISLGARVIMVVEVTNWANLRE